MNIEHEIKLLIEQMQQLGKANADGKLVVKYGVLFDKTADIFETLMGTLKAAKKRKIITFEGPPLPPYPPLSLIPYLPLIPPH